MTRPWLVIGWGNASRGDDALGPLAVDALRAAWGARGDVEFLDEHQLQVEHALDLQGRRGVLFVDASLQAAPPFELGPVQARRDASFSSHALSPQALLAVSADILSTPVPPCTLLAIAAQQFELGAPPSAQALAHLQAALQQLRHTLPWSRLFEPQGQPLTTGPTP
jgi:hydrogenase maturation protease